MNFQRLSRLNYRRGSQLITRNFSSIQMIVFYYLLMIILSIGLFYLPIFRVPGNHVPFIDLVFLAISTVSVTGLTTVPITEVFNHNGIVLLEILFQIGGLGIMMISTFFIIVSRRKISLKQRQLIMTDMNQPKLSGIVKMIQTTFTMLIFIQAIAGLFFGFYFKLHGYYSQWSTAFFYGFYQAISAVTNSGFDVTGDSIFPFAKDSVFLLGIMLLIFIGSIGFPVLMDIHEACVHHFSKKRKRIPFRFSLFTKLALLAFIVLFIGGAFFIYLLENQHLFANMSLGDKLLNSAFYSMTTRNAGLQIHDLTEFQTTTLMIFSLLMFIGCSPSSVGGGIRTTTIAIIALYLFSFLKGEKHVNVFGRKIASDDVQKSIAVFMLSLTLCFFCIILLSATETAPLIALIVEVTSAFGTTGLSLGITADLTSIGKIVIALLMFIGRIGMLYTLLLFVPKETRDLGYTYPTEKIIIG